MSRSTSTTTARLSRTSQSCLTRQRSDSSQTRQPALLGRIAREERGISLVELIVAIALTAIISTLLVTIVVTVSRSFTREAHASTNSDSASVGMHELSRVIRAAAEVSLSGSPAGTAPADAVISAGANQITLYSFVDAAAAPAPFIVQFSVVADGTLSESRRIGSAVVPTGGVAAASTSTTVWQFEARPSSTRTILRGVVSTAAAPLLRYYNAAGVELVLPASGVLDATQLSAVASVRVTLRVQQFPAAPGAGAGSGGAGGGTGTAALLDNTIGLPNLGVSRIRSAP
jgi:Tfp pilus assembly protein PilW